MPHYRQTPHYWWPKDHAWCVAGDVDLSWTIIGGSRDLIEHLINAEDLEVLSISQDDVLESGPPGVK
ncbi:hypothetical protein [Sulfobacillus thermosulfidooxidans]|uniref:hypothetical protein n=1 Tax=Sulfobacillus thermosulfidooxidans TaxID=28034 RepID=UPI00096BAA57|nr:hypothetical protein [Sulfobacillus thermosulfidooxidans]OLZ15182.1 hypothetical protein BFX06_04385 [Sulfobacillus thermosulfidooxidans]OLZ22171.1 hypothetical protein BFX07_09905 [Sulfobacillus thermosulfidooxidans]